MYNHLSELGSIILCKPSSGLRWQEDEPVQLS